MTSKNLLLFLSFFSAFFQLSAQTYGDPEFYLSDSINLDKITPEERSRLDSILSLYHNRDLNNDTLGVYYLEQLIGNFESGNLEKWYRYEYLSVTEALLKSSTATGVIKRRLNFARGYSLANVGILFWSRSNQDSALVYLLQAEPFLAKSDSINYQALVINAASTCYKNLGKLNEAVALSMEALELVERSADSSSMGSVYNNLGGLHQSLGNYDKSLNYYNRAIVCTRAIGFPQQAGIGMANIAELYFTNLKDTLAAEKTILEAELLITDEKSNTNMYLKKSVYEVLAKLKLSQGDLVAARNYYNEVLVLANMMRSSIDLARTYNGLAAVEHQEGNLDKAKELVLQSLEICEENVLTQEGLQANITAAEIYKSLGDYKSSLEYFQKASITKEILRDQDQKKAILKQSYDYDFKKKTEIDSLENSKILAVAAANEKTAKVEAEKSKFQSIIAIAVTLLVVIFLWIIFNRLKVIRSKNKELDIAYEKLEETKKHELAASNLKAIKSQMNPHFIFNAVNSIQDLVLQQETIKSYDYLVLFAQMVRTILDHSEREFIPLSEEVTFLNKYLGLEKLRFEEDFNFEIITDDCPQGIFIPSLIIQPFAENAIKHGLLHKDGPKKLTIRFEYTDELICFVEDNGVGEIEAKKIQGNKSSQHKSFSTDAIAKRLKLLQEQTNSEAKYCSSTIYDGSKVLGTMVKINLPIKS